MLSTYRLLEGAKEVTSHPLQRLMQCTYILRLDVGKHYAKPGLCYP